MKRFIDDTLTSINPLGVCSESSRRDFMLSPLSPHFWRRVVRDNVRVAVPSVAFLLRLVDLAANRRGSDFARRGCRDSPQSQLSLSAVGFRRFLGVRASSRCFPFSAGIRLELRVSICATPVARRRGQCFPERATFGFAVYSCGFGSYGSRIRHGSGGMLSRPGSELRQR